MEKLREKEGRGSAPFPALAGASRCLPGEERGAGAGSAAPPAAGARQPLGTGSAGQPSPGSRCRSLPLPTFAWPRVSPAHGAGCTPGAVSRGKAAGELLRAPGPRSGPAALAAPLPRRASASRPGGWRRAQGPRVLRPPGVLRPPRPLSVAVLGVQLQAALPLPPPTKDKFIFHVLSAAAERVGVGWVPPLPGGCGGEDLARERKDSCLLDNVELYHVRKTSYYPNHLKLLESHSVLLFSSLVLLCFFYLNRGC